MAFASTADVARRLGRDSLTDTETEMAEWLLAAAGAVIAVAADKDDAWATGLDPVPTILKVVATEVVVRVMENPSSLHSVQETLGAHSRSTSFRKVAEGGGLLLSDTERMLIRLAVYGTATASTRADTMLSRHGQCEPA
jgi:hypothetical protein